MTAGAGVLGARRGVRDRAADARRLGQRGLGAHHGRSRASGRWSPRCSPPGSAAAASARTRRTGPSRTIGGGAARVRRRGARGGRQPVDRGLVRGPRRPPARVRHQHPAHAAALPLRVHRHRAAARRPAGHRGGVGRGRGRVAVRRARHAAARAPLRAAVDDPGGAGRRLRHAAPAGGVPQPADGARRGVRDRAGGAGGQAVRRRRRAERGPRRRARADLRPLRRGVQRRLRGGGGAGRVRRAAQRPGPVALRGGERAVRWWACSCTTPSSARLTPTPVRRRAHRSKLGLRLLPAERPALHPQREQVLVRPPDQRARRRSRAAP